MIVTFYSYKGGVGRSMTLANVACQLANRHGLRVLVIDWDLEAPGLHFYFDHQDTALRRKRGLVELLRDAEQNHGDVDLARYVMKPGPKVRKLIQFGDVDLLPCGRLDEDYMERVADFSWPNFYNDHEGFDRLEEIKSRINAQYDICLIDARAGQSDTNVAPTTQLADALVLLFTSNNQSLVGTEELCRRFHSARLRGVEQAAVPIILVPSRVFPFQPSYQRWLAQSAEPMYRRLVEDQILRRRDQPNGLAHVTLPVEPAFTAGEQLPILNPEASGLGLVSGYRELVELLLDLKNDDDMLWRPDRLLNSGMVNDAAVGSLRADLKDAADRGDEVGAATIRLKLARYLREFHRYSEAESLALSSLTYLRGRNDRALEPLAMHTLGQIDYARGAYDDAIQHYDDALAMLTGEDFRRAVLLHDLAVARHRRGDTDLAEQLLQASIAIKSKLGDIRGQALSVHQLGNLALTRRDTDRATALFGEAFNLAIEANDELGAAISLHQLGNVKARAGDLAGALECFLQSLKMHQSRNDLRGSAITRRRIGDIYGNMGDPDQALLSYHAALEAAQVEGDLRSIQSLHRRIGDVFLSQDRFEAAKEQWVTALGVAEGLALKDEVARTLLKLSEVELKLDKARAAYAYLQRAASLVEESHSESLGRQLAEVRALNDAPVHAPADEAIADPA